MVKGGRRAFGRMAERPSSPLNAIGSVFRASSVQPTSRWERKTPANPMTRAERPRADLASVIVEKVASNVSMMIEANNYHAGFVEALVLGTQGTAGRQPAKKRRG